MHLSVDQISALLIAIALMLFTAKLFGEILVKFNQPSVMGEIFAGVILGPTVLGMISPSTFSWLFLQHEVALALNALTTLSVVLLLLVSGLEVDLSVIIKHRKSAAAVSSFGTILPFIVGFSISYFYPSLMGIGEKGDRLIFSLFIGTALSISALPVITKTLLDLNILKDKIGLIIISSAMISDFVGWLLFSLILGMIGAGINNFSFWETGAYTLLFVFVMIFFGRRIISSTLAAVNKNFSFPGSSMNLILILGLLGASFTELIGIHAVFGAFIIGITFGDSVHLKDDTKQILHQFITNIFAPLFFVSIGLRVNFIANFDLQIVGITVLLAFITKVAGCGIGAAISGMNKSDSMIVGFGMNSRGAMEIILASLALQYGLIQETVFVALVIMALITSLFSAPLMNYFLKRNSEQSFKNLITKSRIIFSIANDKANVVDELTALAADELKLNKTEIIQSVMKREELFPTGIANHLAIPHARVKIKKPYIAIAVHKSGLNFDASDGLPAKIILLLLTPENNNELQLKLLAEIGNYFRDINKSFELIAADSVEAVIARLKR